MIDGTGFGNRTLIVALGVTDANQKGPLELIEGNTENAEIVKDLLKMTTALHFTFAAERILAVPDGGKALRADLLALWGTKVEMLSNISRSQISAGLLPHEKDYVTQQLRRRKS
jgi:hypothetical protein